MRDWDPMKILYDHQIFSWQKYGGISRYFFELMTRFGQDPGIDFEISLLLSVNAYLPDSELAFPNIVLKNVNFPKKDRIYERIDKQYSKIRISRGDFDVFHPTYYDPYFLKYLGDTPFVLTVYDMIHEVYPGYFSPEDPVYFNKKMLIQSSAKVIAISENTKKDILRFCDVDASKIEVIHLGNSLQPRAGPPTISVPENYILYVGDRHLYKNFTNFVASVSPLLRRSVNPLFLVCAGGEEFSAGEIQLLEKFSIRNRVVKLPADDELLSYLYENALCFVFPSLYEGFGIPILEAFSTGCPVVLSRASSFPEVAGDAAIYFDPLDNSSIFDAVSYVITNPDVRSALIEAGHKRMKMFSWDITAAKTKETYQRSLINE